MTTMLRGDWNPVFPAKWERADGHLVEFESSPQASDGDVLCVCSRQERALGRQLTNRMDLMCPQLWAGAREAGAMEPGLCQLW